MCTRSGFVIIFMILSFFSLVSGTFYYRISQHDKQEISNKLESLSYYTKAKEYMKQKSFNRAIFQLEIANKLQKNNYNVMTELALLYMTVGNVEKAMNLAEEAKRINPKDLLAYKLLGDIFNLKGEYDKAFEQFNDAFIHNKDNIYLLNSIGKTYIYLNQLDEAEKYINLALMKDKNYPEANLNKAWIYFYRGKYPQSIAFVKKVLSSTNQSAEGFYLYGRNLYSMGIYKFSEVELLKAIAVQPDDINAYAYLIKCQLSMQKFYTALDTTKKLTNIHNFNFSLNKNHEQEIFVEIINILKTHQSHYKNIRELYSAIAGLYIKLNRFQEALKTYEAYLSHESSDLLFNIANLYYRQNEYNKALDYYQKAIKKKPESALYHYGLAQLYFAQADYKEAIPLLQKVLQFDGNFNIARVLLGNCYDQDHEPLLAIKYFQQALDVNKVESYAYLGLGDVYISQNNKKKALTNYLKFLDLATDVTDRMKVTEKVLKLIDEVGVEWLKSVN